MKMQAPENCGGFTTAGEAFEVAEDGTIEIPSQHVELARSHGFTDLVEPEKKAPLKKGKQAEKDEA